MPHRPAVFQPGSAGSPAELAGRGRWGRGGACAAGRLDPQGRVVALGSVGLLIVAAVTRIAGVQGSLWWDEAFTAHRYVRGGPPTWLDPELYFANNHLLFSATTWAVTRVIGTSEPALRLLAVVPATAAVVWLVVVAWRRSGAAVGLLLAGFATTSTLLLAMSTQARGYGLVIAAATVMLVVPVRADRHPSWGHDLAVAGAGVVAMATFPPTVALYLAHAGVWLLRRQVHRVRLVVTTAVAGAMSFVVYLPLLELLLERSDRVGSRFADPISWWSPVVAPLQLVGGPSFSLGRGAVALWTLPALAALALGLLGLVVAAVRDRGLVAHLLAGLGGSVVLLAPFGFHLADRYISFLLPHALVAMAIGGAAALGAGRRGDAAGRRGDAAVRSGVVVAVLVAISVPGLWWSATTPVQAFGDVVDDIRVIDGVTVVVDRLHVGYAWYLEDLPVEVVRAPDQAGLEQLLCEPTGPVVFARNPDRPELAVPDCLAAGTERRYDHQVEPGWMAAWFVTGTS